MSKKITRQEIDDMVNKATFQYHHFEGTTTTVCLLTLQSGFSVVGSSACISPDDFNPTIGRSEAVKHAANKLWELEGYRRVTAND